MYGLNRLLLNRNYTTKNQDFSITLVTIKTIQENSLINKVITCKFNITIIKLILSNHSYIEKTRNYLYIQVKRVE
ncbi:MAG: terminase small subunit [Arsenophonus sp. NC-CH8-MAG3]